MSRIELSGSSTGMEEIIKDWLNILMFIFLTLILAFMLAYGRDQKELILILSSLLITSASIRYLLFYESERLYIGGILSILFDAVVMYFISGFDHYGITKIYYLVLISDIIIFYRVKYGVPISIVCYVFWLFLTCGVKGYSSLAEFIPSFISSLIPVIFVIIIMSIVKYVINQHRKLSMAMRELELAHARLDESSRQLEQMVLLQERNRIAGEVHDTVGHTLTAVLMEIEAGKRIMEKNPKEAAGKLELAMEQVRKGLGEINSSIRAIKTGKESPEEFEKQIITIIDEINRYTGVEVLSELFGINKIPEKLYSILAKGLKEGLTNGIRHGKSDQFTFTLSAKEDSIEFVLEDNGVCTENVSYGYGLTFINERTESLEGTMHVVRNARGGCTLRLKFETERNRK